MKHLTPQQFIALLDGRFDPACRTHLEHCAPCRDEVAELRSITAAVSSSADVPEPSPLFWQHFTSRLQQAVAVEPVPAPSWWRGMWRPVAGIGVALACMALVVVVRFAGVRQEAPVGPDVAAMAAASTDQSDQPWEFVLQIASSASPADLDALGAPSSDATASMVESLSGPEREALVRLLKSRMGGAE